MHTYSTLVKDYESKRPRRGDLLKGEILHVDDDAILIDVGAKRDAVVPRKEIAQLDEDQLDDLNIGDKIPVYVLRSAVIGEELQVSIQKGMRQKYWDRAQELFNSGEIIETEVVDQNRGGVLVLFGQLRGFVPNSHIPGLRKNVIYGSKTIKEELIGKSMQLKVIEVDIARRRLILSGRGLGNDFIKRKLQELKVGMVIKGRVVHILDFGAFVDLGGVDGLVHVSELDWGRVEHPSDVVQVGDSIEVRIMDIDVDRERISLSRKTLLPSPWETVYERCSVGDHVEGEVTNVLNYGAFVRLADGIVGLIHESEMGIEGPFYTRDVVKPGESIIVRIVSIDPAKRRMSLSLRFLQSDESQARDRDDGRVASKSYQQLGTRYTNW